MRRLSVLLGAVLGVTSCGGSVSKPEQRTSVEPREGGAGPEADGGRGAGGHAGEPASGAVTSEPLGQARPGDPTIEVGGAFYWRGGLGNWFVSVPDAVTRDAAYEVVDGTRVWTAKAEQGGKLDLWAQLSHPAGNHVDLSPYTAISFEARLQSTNVGDDTSTADAVAITFDANGDVATADATPPERRFVLEEAWQSHELALDAAITPLSVASIDFIATTSRSPFELQLRNVSLRCKATCP